MVGEGRAGPAGGLARRQVTFHPSGSPARHSKGNVLEVALLRVPATKSTTGVVPVWQGDFDRDMVANED